MKIVIVTSGQPSLNPRVIKEADALFEAGFEVTVLYQYWNEWGTAMDKEILPSKGWKYKLVNGSPHQNKRSYWTSRILHKFGSKIFDLTGKAANLAIGRGVVNLATETAKHKADLYIAHNLAALPAASYAAKKNGKYYCFDAEDFHRHEMSDDPASKDVKLKSRVEDKYFPEARYISTASYITSDYYKKIYPNKDFTTILNVFSVKSSIPNRKDASVKPLKLFWFSQTVGLNRGLQNILEALKHLEGFDIEFSILGHLSSSVQSELEAQIERLQLNKERISFHDPVSPERLTEIASCYDIGFASEPGFSINNNIALSNKFFTYIHAGMAILASDTPGQKALMQKFPELGQVYPNNKPEDLSNIIKEYYQDSNKLHSTKLASFKTGQIQLNWEQEKLKFLALVNTAVHS